MQGSKKGRKDGTVSRSVEVLLTPMKERMVINDVSCKISPPPMNYQGRIRSDSLNKHILDLVIVLGTIEHTCNEKL